MADITVRFACQHPTVDVSKDADEDTVAALECPVCGERRVQRTLTSAPRIIAKDCPASFDMGPLVRHYAE